MCFTQEMSGVFALIGLYIAYYIYRYTNNTRLAIGVLWFFVMEALQFFQYFWIDDCASPINQVLTLFGFFHICFQPFFCHLINSGLTKSPKFLTQYDFLLKLCLLGGAMYFGRYFLTSLNNHATHSDFTDWSGGEIEEGSVKTEEWIRGEVLCTYNGKHHLAWSLPMAEPTYWIPSGAIHSFLMFGPFFVMKKNMWIQGIFLWATGPFLASYITPNLQEQASIWCFFSIAQIGIMLFLIREQLLLTWGRDKKHIGDGSIVSGKDVVSDKNKKSK
eukprot:TRINITY_DN17480_c0_g1_i1.p1 TRINITY_DN17480_c0_g1~~TRINITY_DN17480_c0_g1_i1.p1  ORF type:complete len:281 (-),score=86.45 TRINITY_DN17480_c0_g1_i1:15-836(-)